MANRTETSIQVRVPVAIAKSDFAALDRLAKQEQIGRSTLMRRAFRFYLASLERAAA